MGYYTKLKFTAKLKKDLPEEVVNFFRRCLEYEEEHPAWGDVHNPGKGGLNDHPFFSRDRWYWVLTWHDCNGHGLNFDGFREVECGCVQIHIDTELKNYCQSIQFFLAFIHNFIDVDPDWEYGELQGEYDEEPTIITGQAIIRAHMVVQEALSKNQGTIDSELYLAI